MIYQDGLSDRFGHPIPVLPYLQKYKQDGAIQFCPDYQFLIGDDAIMEMEKELEGMPSTMVELKEMVLSTLPNLKSPIRREIIRLILEENKEIAEIAIILNCTYTNIYMHVNGDPRYANSGAIAQIRRLVKSRTTRRHKTNKRNHLLKIERRKK